MAPRPDDPDDGVPPQGADVPGEAGQPSDEDVWQGIVAQLGDLDGFDGKAEPEPDAAAPRDLPVAPWVADSRVVRPAPDLSGRDWEGTAQFDEAEADGRRRGALRAPGPRPGARR